ncbi:MAG: alpha/beta hydrolase, partial [Methanospirillum hungatei]|nr:alpha/beta hydrolase [Methanospirillum hungatei]
VLEHPVERWDVNTRILYGAKDNLVEFDTIQQFTGKFPSIVEIMDDGEHYFHTDEQLERYTGWLSSHIT